jgi:NAD(P)-dependent dehydrogenase (short-subunit alcohol dehydrogenase family)
VYLSEDEDAEETRRAVEAEGRRAVLIPGDVTDPKFCRRAVETTVGELGRLDILVNNAAIARADGGWLPSETTLETLRAVYETNVFGVVAVTNAMLPLLRRATAARIVNVSSEVGSIASTTDPNSPLWPLTSVPYPSSKTALNMITAMYAKELRDTPIKVNAANPGYCATDLNGHSGFLTAEQGATVSVHLATLPENGPTGLFWGSLWTGDDADSHGALSW